MKKNIIIVLFITNYLLIWCNSENSWNQINTYNNWNNSLNTYNQKNKYISTNTPGLTVKIIKIDSNCIWCWKCSRINPVNFTMNYQTRKAEPTQTSWENINLQQAIKHCPTRSISYN